MELGWKADRNDSFIPFPGQFNPSNQRRYNVGVHTDHREKGIFMKKRGEMDDEFASLIHACEPDVSQFVDNLPPDEERNVWHIMDSLYRRKPELILQAN